MPITVTPTVTTAVLVIESKAFGDNCGWFYQQVHEKDFSIAVGKLVNFL